MAKKETNEKDKVKAQKLAEDEKPRETTVEFLASLASVLVTGLFIITFVFQAFEIPSASMENTLLIGDHVFVNRVQFSPKTPLGRADRSLQPDSSRRHRCVSFRRPDAPPNFTS